MLKMFRSLAVLLIAVFLLSAYGAHTAAAQPAASGVTIQFERSYDLLATNYVPPFAYVCELKSQSPAMDTYMTPLQQFDMVWVVKNIGVLKWRQTDFDYKYVSGTHFEIYKSRYDLPKDVAAGATVSLKVPMISPQAPGLYWTKWVLILSPATNRCNLNMRLYVKKTTP